VESLLAQAQSTDGFLDAPALDVAARELAASQEPGTPSHPPGIGPYRIIRLLGEGGMGAVYEAEQEEPRRVVALKVIKLGLATPDRLRRFRQESRALARLQHQGIAQIYEFNTADTGFGQQPYLAMEFIRGLPLKQYAEVRQLNTRQKLALMVKICDAVHHAHQRGLIHRDLKPGNILVDEAGQPKILDFGVARITSAYANEPDVQEEGALPTMQTNVGQIIGTLAYMSPEQVLGDPLEVDTRSDVYSLGVILYELLSGRLPYQVSSHQLPEAVRTIREEESAPLSAIDRNYRGDIETLVKKALEKDKTRRYASAADLSADIQRYLSDEPIAARPPSTAYQLQKFARRHFGLMAGLAAVFFVLLAGVAVSSWMAVRARRAEAEARAVNNFLRNDLLAQASAASQAGPNSRPDPDLKVRTALDRAAGRIEGKFAGQPLVEASLRQTIGEAYRDLGLFLEAERQMRQSLSLRQRALGRDHADILISIQGLGGVLVKQSKFAEADKLLTQVLAARSRTRGDDAPETVSVMNDLALAVGGLGDYTRSEQLLVRVLEIQLRVLGEQNPDTLSAMNNLAVVYTNQGKYPEAEQLYQRAYEVKRRFLGEEHPSTLTTMNNLAVVYRFEGKFMQAEALLTKVLEVQRRVLGEQHQDTLNSANSLALVYQAELRYQDSESLLLRVLEARSRVLGAENPQTLATMNNLADLYSQENKQADAEALFQKILDVRRRVQGAAHPNTIDAMAAVGRIKMERNQYAGATPLLREALDGYTKAHSDAWRRYLTENLLGHSLAAQGKYDSGEPLLISGYEGLMRRQATIPAQNRRVLSESGERIVQLYEKWGKPEKAEEWGEKLQPKQ
jgi:tetratricopeptide (TPR) repeat protein